MAGKLIDSSQVRVGNAILVEGKPCIVRSNDISKTGKHGHAKCRIEAIGVMDGKKKVFVASGHERLEIPMILKNKAQVLSIAGDNVSVMDLESFETIEIGVPEDLKGQLNDGDQIEYWEAEGSRIIKRKL